MFTPHRARHSFAIATLERLVSGYRSGHENGLLDEAAQREANEEFEDEEGWDARAAER